MAPAPWRSIPADGVNDRAPPDERYRNQPPRSGGVGGGQYHGMGGPQPQRPAAQSAGPQRPWGFLKGGPLTASAPYQSSSADTSSWQLGSRPTEAHRGPNKGPIGFQGGRDDRIGQAPEGRPPWPSMGGNLGISTQGLQANAPVGVYTQAFGSSPSEYPSHQPLQRLPGQIGQPYAPPAYEQTKQPAQSLPLQGSSPLQDLLNLIGGRTQPQSQSQASLAVAPPQLLRPPPPQQPAQQTPQTQNELVLNLLQQLQSHQASQSQGPALNQQIHQVSPKPWQQPAASGPPAVTPAIDMQKTARELLASLQSPTPYQAGSFMADTQSAPLLRDHGIGPSRTGAVLDVRSQFERAPEYRRSSIADRQRKLSRETGRRFEKPRDARQVESGSSGRWEGRGDRRVNEAAFISGLHDDYPRPATDHMDGPRLDHRNGTPAPLREIPSSTLYAAPNASAIAKPTNGGILSDRGRVGQGNRRRSRSPPRFLGSGRSRSRERQFDRWRSPARLRTVSAQHAHPAEPIPLQLTIGGDAWGGWAPQSEYTNSNAVMDIPGRDVARGGFPQSKGPLFRERRQSIIKHDADVPSRSTEVRGHHDLRGSAGRRSASTGRRRRLDDRRIRSPPGTDLRRDDAGRSRWEIRDRNSRLRSRRRRGDQGSGGGGRGRRQREMSGVQQSLAKRAPTIPQPVVEKPLVPAIPEWLVGKSVNDMAAQENIIPYEALWDAEQTSVSVLLDPPRLWAYSCNKGSQEVADSTRANLQSVGKPAKQIDKCLPGLLITGLPNVSATGLQKALHQFLKVLRVPANRVTLSVYPETGLCQGWGVIEPASWSSVKQLFNCPPFHWRGICAKLRPLTCPQLIQANAFLTCKTKSHNLPLSTSLGPQHNRIAGQLDPTEWTSDQFVSVLTTIKKGALSDLSAASQASPVGKFYFASFLSSTKRLYLSVAPVWPLAVSLLRELLNQRRQEQSLWMFHSMVANQMSSSLQVGEIIPPAFLALSPNKSAEQLTHTDEGAPTSENFPRMPDELLKVADQPMEMLQPSPQSSSLVETVTGPEHESAHQLMKSTIGGQKLDAQRDHLANYFNQLQGAVASPERPHVQSDQNVSDVNNLLSTSLDQGQQHSDQTHQNASDADVLHQRQMYENEVMCESQPDDMLLPVGPVDASFSDAPGGTDAQPADAQPASTNNVGIITPSDACPASEEVVQSNNIEMKAPKNLVNENSPIDNESEDDDLGDDDFDDIEMIDEQVIRHGDSEFSRRQSTSDIITEGEMDVSLSDDEAKGHEMSAVAAARMEHTPPTSLIISEANLSDGWNPNVPVASMVSPPGLSVGRQTGDDYKSLQQKIDSIPTVSVGNDIICVKQVSKEDEFGFMSQFSFGNYSFFAFELLGKFCKDIEGAKPLESKASDCTIWASHLIRDGINTNMILDTVYSIQKSGVLQEIEIAGVPLELAKIGEVVEIPYLCYLSQLPNFSLDSVVPDILDAFKNLEDGTKMSWNIQLYRFAETKRCRGDGLLLLPSNKTVTQLFESSSKTISLQSKSMSHFGLLQPFYTFASHIEADMQQISKILTALLPVLLSKLESKFIESYQSDDSFDIIKKDMPSDQIVQFLLEEVKAPAFQLLQTGIWCNITIESDNKLVNTSLQDSQPNGPTTNVNGETTDTVTSQEAKSDRKIESKFESKKDIGVELHGSINRSILTAHHLLQSFFFSPKEFFDLPTFKDIFEVIPVTPKTTTSPFTPLEPEPAAKTVLLTSELKRKLDTLATHSLPNLIVPSQLRALSVLKEVSTLLGIDDELFDSNGSIMTAGPLSLDKVANTPAVVSQVVEALNKYVEASYPQVVPTTGKKTPACQWLLFENDPDWQATVRIPSIVCEPATRLMTLTPFELTGDFCGSSIEAKVNCAVGFLRYIADLETRMLSTLGVSQTEVQSVVIQVQEDPKILLASTNNTMSDDQRYYRCLPSADVSWDPVAHQKSDMFKLRLKAENLRQLNISWSSVELLTFQEQKLFRYVPLEFVIETPKHKCAMSTSVQQLYRQHERLAKASAHDTLFQSIEEDVILSDLIKKGVVVLPRVKQHVDLPTETKS